MYLQGDNKQFGKYVGYGCWCLTGGDMDLGQPTGQAVDAIDRACRDYHHCTRCLQLDFPTLENELSCNMFRGYRFTGVQSRTGDREIKCNNVGGSCQNTICNCDSRLAETLALLEDTWNINNHIAWGGFDRAKRCVAKTSKIQPRADKCCGTKPHRFPFNSMDDSRACCGGKTFWRAEGCCLNDELQNLSACAHSQISESDFADDESLDTGSLHEQDMTNPFTVLRPEKPNGPSSKDM